MTIQNQLALQIPLQTGFGPRTTAKEALGGQDLSGKFAIVTGGYAGLGLETAKALASAGATVIVPARTTEKAQAALSAVPGVELERIGPYGSRVHRCVCRAVPRFRPAFAYPDQFRRHHGDAARSRFARLESQLATNHLGHFQLAARLWPALKKAEGARIVSVSSRGHQLGALISKIPTSMRGTMSDGRRTRNRRRRTCCLPWPWTSAENRMACGPFPFIRARSSRI